jgi:hypothetical protein
MRLALTYFCLALCFGPLVRADDVAAPATQPAAFQHVKIDIKNKQIRVDCEAVNVDMPLEFFCVENGGPEHETVLRTPAKPSEIHFGLLALGLTPGQPAHYVESTKTWFPPSGPPLHISCEFTVNGITRTVPAYRMMRDIKTKQTMPPLTWVFDGSRVMPDGTYAADITSYVVSIVNFDLTMIDVPELASNANETLEWEYNPDVCPKKGTPVTMIIEPAGDLTAPPPKGIPAENFNPGPGLHTDSTPATQPQAEANPDGPQGLYITADGGLQYNGQALDSNLLTEQFKALKAQGTGGVNVSADPSTKFEDVLKARDLVIAAGLEPKFVSKEAATTQPISTVTIDDATMKRLHDRWEQAVEPHAAALREAAQAHYDVINSMRREQQRLVDEADRIQRAIDELEKEYQDMTTPRPDDVGDAPAASAATQPSGN